MACLVLELIQAGWVKKDVLKISNIGHGDLVQREAHLAVRPKKYCRFSCFILDYHGAGWAEECLYLCWTASRQEVSQDSWVVKAEVEAVAVLVFRVHMIAEEVHCRIDRALAKYEYDA